MSPFIAIENLDPRTLTLRQRCQERKTLLPPCDGDPRLIARSLQATPTVSSWTIRRGLLTRDLLIGMPLALDDLELLVGRLALDLPEWQVERPKATAYILAHYPTVFTPGQTGHCQLDLSRLFSLGLDNLKADLAQRRHSSCEKTAEVYQSFCAALDGFTILIENAARLAEQNSQFAGRDQPQVTEPRRHELEEMAAACHHVAHHPPETFRQALQLTWLAILGCQYADRAWLVSPGHLDRILAPYYLADLAIGKITPEYALLLLENLYLLLNENIPDGLAISVMVGGRDANGQDLTNPLSYLCLEALRRTKLVYPTVGICWHAGTPVTLIDLAIDLITRGYANPAFFGDETIQRGLQLYGVPPQESWNYVNSTCVEITPVGSSNIWVASPYYSTCKLLIDEIAEQVQTGTEAVTFEAFTDRYCQRLARQVATAVAVENDNRIQRQQHGGKPLQSVFTRDCIARGRDIDDGGARYNWVECSFVGLANLADSLYVLREEVYHLKRHTLAAFHHILEANYQGYEVERQRYLHAYPKYGNDCSEIDSLVGEIIAVLRRICAQHRLEPDDSPYVPGAFCWIMHEHLGRECGATPDGRQANFPFADGCGAAQGRERNGPTAAALSVTSWDAAPLIGGAAFNLKFSTSLFSIPGSVRGLRDLVLTFLQMGGFETQINVVDQRILREAQAHPEAYRDLVVRIGGYTDYFTRLTPEMQAEVILRTEYNGI